jgi:hypothetical protein
MEGVEKQDFSVKSEKLKGKTNKKTKDKRRKIKGKSKARLR